MSVEFILIQILGFVAWILLAVSYYRKNTNKILVFQIIGTLLYALHYYLLGAYSGMFICLFEVLRDFSYYKTDWDKYIFMGSIPIYLTYGILNYTNIISTFPIVASIVDGFSLTGKKKVVIIGAIIEYVLWVIYDIIVMSYSGAITDGIVAISNISILLFDKSLFKEEKINRLKK